jgi:hypothetical protein
MFALLADPMMRRASAQLGPAENANIQAQELAEEGARLLIVARAALAALPDNPLVVRGAMRGMRQWARAYGEFRRSNDYDYDPKAGKTQVRLSKKLRMLFQQMGKLYIALRPPELEAKPQPAVPRDPFRTWSRASCHGPILDSPIPTGTAGKRRGSTTPAAT